MRGGPSRGLAVARIVHNTLRDMLVVLCPPPCSPPFSPLSLLSLVVLPWCLLRDYPGFWLGRGVGWRGGGAEAGTGPRPPVFPLGGADAT